MFSHRRNLLHAESRSALGDLEMNEEDIGSELMDVVFDYEDSQALVAALTTSSMKATPSRESRGGLAVLASPRPPQIYLKMK
mgnify:CR=1 FL=1